MLTGLIILHVVVCLLLITVVLLQFGKGAETGAVMGGSAGGSQQIFTSSQQGNFFTKATSVLAAVFMINSIAISVLTSKKSKESIFDGTETPVAQPLNSDSATGEVNPSKTEKKTETPPKSK